ncbi:MAG TPA: serine/threonine-protein kinase, partial [Candidatus Saccharimonadales bacterium]|nr:serine/threonine-protein kinase [Candidatus Saccharimonadales bacterium]
MSLAAGEHIGPYVIAGPLGAGGMGEVYRARDTRLERDVALKVLPERTAADQEALSRFEREAKAIAALSHPNILAIHDLGVHEGKAYSVTELLEGETLRSRLGGGALPLRKGVDYALQIAHGLAAAHDKGVIHRDLKPENLFVTHDGRVKILDFGIAKLAQPDAGDGGTAAPTVDPGTLPGTVIGTLGYMSPEQVRGAAVDPRSDLFSFGAVLYEMLSGRRAFRGDTPADTISAILREDPPDLSQTGRNVAPGVERVVRHCLEKSPSERFQSARDVAFALEALTETSVSGALAGAPALRERARLRMHPVPAVAVLAVAAAAAFAAGWFAGRSGAPSGVEFEQITHAPQAIYNAAVAPDGK